MSTYISKNQIDGNLRRTAELQLISKLSVEELNLFAKKYYWNDEHNCYICPYTGKLIKDYNDLVLEHIIPVSSRGGTVLFNCVPAHKSINGTDQKGAKHLLDWWIDTEYFTPERLETLVNYMLDAYNQVFTTYTEEEILNSYEEFYNDEEQEQTDDLSERININEQKELQEQTKNNHIGSYLDFLISCIQELEKRNIDTTTIRNKLNNLEERNIFNQISIFETYQTTIQDILKSYTGEDTRSYLTYSLYFNIPKLMQSLNLTDKEQIKQTLYLRFNYINTILIQNNISFKDYLNNIQDIEDIDLIYLNPNNITLEQTLEFINNIKIGKKTKILSFIEMLNRGNIGVLKAKNEETYKIYNGKEDKTGIDTEIKVRAFWHFSRKQIKETLDDREKYGEDYNMARGLIKEWEFANRNNVSQRIETFIEMLNRGNIEILNQKTQETYKIYNGKEDKTGRDTEIKIGSFWGKQQQQIREFLEDKERYGEEYNIARKLIKQWEFANIKNSNSRIESFIEMLNRGNIKILNQRNQETYKIYNGKEDKTGIDTEIKIRNFWSTKKQKIQELLENHEKYGEEYNIARKLIKQWEFANPSNAIQRIESFIEMLNRGNIKILKAKNKETYKIYNGKEDKIGKDTEIKIGSFWSTNQQQIREALFGNKQYKDTSYDTARTIILDKYKVSSYEELKRKEEAKNKAKALKKRNKELKQVEASLNQSINTGNRKRA